MESVDPLFTVEGLAAYLDVPVATLYAWRCRGEGPLGFRVGKHLRYRTSDVEDWIRDRIEHTQYGRGQ